MLTLKDLGLRARQAPVTARLTTKSTQIWGQSQVYRFLKQERMIPLCFALFHMHVTKFE